MKARGSKSALTLEPTALGTGVSCEDKSLHFPPKGEEVVPGRIELNHLAVAALREFFELLDRWDCKQGDCRGEKEL